MWTPAKASADKERAALEEYVASLASSAGNTASQPETIEAWDWRYYAEKVSYW